MIDRICLNCQADVNSRFCPDCGQKSGTSRITLKHFIQHDLMHGFWHLDKGIIFTLREALFRPGQAALDYIRGRRIRYYNVFYLSLLLIGLHLILQEIYVSAVDYQSDNTTEVSTFFRDNIKVLLLCTVPLLACNAWVIFRRIKLNIAEHFIMGGFTLVGILFFTILFLFSDFLSQVWSNNISGWMEVVFFISAMFFPSWAYSNMCRKRYTILGLSWRILVFQVLLIIEMLLILSLIFYFITGSNDLQISM